ncbi:MAG TPA: hypothetical protein VFI70_10145 [Nitrososphaeraceae archaeon]|nr:hypothetical protein [Nitrososphaeraceae archaeon]
MKKNRYTCSSSSPLRDWKLFASRACRFLEKTREHILEGLNPGGIYQDVWFRDASYILKDWFLSGNVDGTMQQIYHTWSHQIIPGGAEKLVYGRGSPEMKFEAKELSTSTRNKFEGALPTTTYQAGFSEIYGQNPDIDSTSLMISTTSWILARLLNYKENKRQKRQEDHLYEDFSILPPSSIIASEHAPNDVSTYLLSKADITDPFKVAEFAIPRMLKGIEYLKRRDVDNDGLLEQNYNEDWMDTALRTGKIVYSQACWILALKDFYSLLARFGMDKEAIKLIQFADRTICGVEKKLWSKEDSCYIDLQESESRGREPYRLLTQDVLLYLIAISQNTTNDSLRIHYQNHYNKEQNQGSKIIHEELHNRAVSTLDTMRKRTWKDKWPLSTETELMRTGPWILKPYQYHNHAFWPWTTGTEMLARSRFNKLQECDILLSGLSSDDGDPHPQTFYEWINPITCEGAGAYPFRTGISAIRLALYDVVEKIKMHTDQRSHLR